MKKISFDIKTVIIFICVLLKYLIEYKINSYILYSAVLVILFFQLLITIKSMKGRKKIVKAFIFCILSIISVFGDLLFSKIKRENDIKDFSDLIPGHGGILDRFDSFIFVVLAYTIIQRFI